MDNRRTKLSHRKGNFFQLEKRFFMEKGSEVEFFLLKHFVLLHYAIDPIYKLMFYVVQNIYHSLIIISVKYKWLHLTPESMYMVWTCMEWSYSLNLRPPNPTSRSSLGDEIWEKWWCLICIITSMDQDKRSKK